MFEQKEEIKENIQISEFLYVLIHRKLKFPSYELQNAIQ